MNRILKIEVSLCFALSFLIVFSSLTGVSTFNYVEVLKIVEIILIIIGCILLPLPNKNNINVGKFDLLSIGIYLILLILIILRGYIAPSINVSYYFEGPVKRIMYFSYYSYIIMFPLTILVFYIISFRIKSITSKKKH